MYIICTNASYTNPFTLTLVRTQKEESTPWDLLKNDHVHGANMKQRKEEQNWTPWSVKTMPWLPWLL